MFPCGPFFPVRNSSYFECALPFEVKRSYAVSFLASCCPLLLYCHTVQAKIYAELYQRLLLFNDMKASQLGRTFL